MGLLLKGSISSVMIAFSVASFTNISASDKEENVLDNGSNKANLMSMIKQAATLENASYIESEYEFDLADCQRIIENTLPFQDSYKNCENKIQKVNTYLTSL